MEYSDCYEFIRELTRMVKPECKVQLRSTTGEPLRYKIIHSPKNFVYLYLMNENDEVKIGLDFSTYSDETFNMYICNACELLVRAGNQAEY